MIAAPAMKVELTINDDAVKEIFTAINGTAQNQRVLFEMIMNTTLAVGALVDVIKNTPGIDYNERSRTLINSIDLEVLDAQIHMCRDALVSWDEMQNENVEKI